MSDINLITPPDKLFNQSINILFLYPSDETKKELQTLLKNSNKKCNLYLYECNEDHYYDWLLEIHRTVDFCIINLDLLPVEIKSIEAYLISFANTYYQTRGENILYNKISNNKIFNLDFLIPTLGGSVEIF